MKSTWTTSDPGVPMRSRSDALTIPTFLEYLIGKHSVASSMLTITQAPPIPTNFAVRPAGNTIDKTPTCSTRFRPILILRFPPSLSRKLSAFHPKTDGDRSHVRQLGYCRRDGFAGKI